MIAIPPGLLKEAAQICTFSNDYNSLLPEERVGCRLAKLATKDNRHAGHAHRAP
jgi:hypothetical protein